jgi:HSP20 family protein
MKTDVVQNGGPAKPTETRALPNIWDPFDADFLGEFAKTRHALTSLTRAMTPAPLIGLLPSGIMALGVDFYQTDGKYVIECELPGVRKEDITVKASGKQLHIHAPAQAHLKEKGTRYFYAGRFYGEFVRTIDLPEMIDVEKIDAVHKDGVLTLTIPAPKEIKTERIPVKG